MIHTCKWHKVLALVTLFFGFMSLALPWLAMRWTVQPDLTAGPASGTVIPWTDDYDSSFTARFWTAGMKPRVRFVRSEWRELWDTIQDAWHALSDDAQESLHGQDAVRDYTYERVTGGSATDDDGDPTTFENSALERLGTACFVLTLLAIGVWIVYVILVFRPNVPLADKGWLIAIAALALSILPPYAFAVIMPDVFARDNDFDDRFYASFGWFGTGVTVFQTSFFQVRTLSSVARPASALSSGPTPAYVDHGYRFPLVLSTETAADNIPVIVAMNSFISFGYFCVVIFYWLALVTLAVVEFSRRKQQLAKEGVVLLGFRSRFTLAAWGSHNGMYWTFVFLGSLCLAAGSVNTEWSQWYTLGLGQNVAYPTTTIHHNLYETISYSTGTVNVGNINSCSEECYDVRVCTDAEVAAGDQLTTVQCLPEANGGTFQPQVLAKRRVQAIDALRSFSLATLIVFAFVTTGVLVEVCREKRERSSGVVVWNGIVMLSVIVLAGLAVGPFAGRLVCDLTTQVIARNNNFLEGEDSNDRLPAYDRICTGLQAVVPSNSIISPLRSLSGTTYTLIGWKVRFLMLSAFFFVLVFGMSLYKVAGNRFGESFRCFGLKRRRGTAVRTEI